MKTQLKSIWLKDSVYRPSLLSRKRASYLIKAARSRRSNNVQPFNNGYLIADCQLYILPA